MDLQLQEQVSWEGKRGNAAVASGGGARTKLSGKCPARRLMQTTINHIAWKPDINLDIKLALPLSTISRLSNDLQLILPSSK